MNVFIGRSVFVPANTPIRLVQFNSKRSYIKLQPNAEIKIDSDQTVSLGSSLYFEFPLILEGENAEVEIWGKFTADRTVQVVEVVKG